MVEHELTFSSRDTALLVIDPVNDFLSEGGAAWELTKGTVKRKDVVANLKRAIEGAREHRIPVLFGPMAFTEEDYAEDHWQRRSGINRIMYEKKMFLAGSWGADFHPDLQPTEDDIILKPHKANDVFETDLPEHLDRLGTRRLVIAGMTANLCCEATGRRAMEKGFDVTFLSDAIGAESLPAYEASVLVNYPLIANTVMEVGEFLSALMRVGEVSDIAVQKGDIVRGSDHLKVGEIDAVVPQEGQIDAYVVISKGLLGSEMYIPLDAVVKRSGTEVFINVPKIMVGKMPWSTPPTSDARQSKQGKPSGEIENLYRSYSPTSHDAGNRP